MLASTMYLTIWCLMRVGNLCPFTSNTHWFNSSQPLVEIPSLCISHHCWDTSSCAWRLLLSSCSPWNVQCFPSHFASFSHASHKVQVQFLWMLSSWFVNHLYFMASLRTLMTGLIRPSKLPSSKIVTCFFMSSLSLSFNRSE